MADWNSEDRFTYQFSDGVVGSNLATVAAVNDAPTLGNQSLATDEDTAVAGQALHLCRCLGHS